MSAAGLEAFFNELAIMAKRSVDMCAQLESAPEPGIMDAFAAVAREAVESKSAITTKYQLAAALLSGRPFDRGAQPFQDFARLVSLRNWLIHLTVDPPGRVVAYLREKGFAHVPENPDTLIDSMSVVGTSAVAAWSCSVASAMIKATLEMLPVGVDPAIDIVRSTFAE